MRVLIGTMVLGGALAVGGPSLMSVRSTPDIVVTPQVADDSVVAKPATRDTAVFAGGCFWGVEAVFEHVRGVTNVVSGYAGGEAKTARYDLVSSGTTGHAESVRVIYDPAQVSYGNLLRVFFSVAHDPTELNRQGPDKGTQYRSEIFYTNADQERIAQAYIKQVDDAKVFKKPIVTKVEPLTAFYAAETYHQDFAAKNPDHPYIVRWDLPKVQQLQKAFPEMYRTTSANTGQ